MDSARLKAVTEGLPDDKSKLGAGRAKDANCRWSRHNIAEGACKVGDDISKALMAESRGVSDAN